MDYSDEIGIRICEGISSGLSVRKSCEEQGLSVRCFWINLAKNEGLMHHYARARENRAMSRAEKIDEICQAVERGEMDPAAARVAIDGHKWLTAREDPKKYGDRLDVTGIPASQTNIVLPIRERIRRLRRAGSEEITESGPAQADATQGAGGES